MKRICLIGSGNVAEAFAVALGGLHPAGRFRLGQIYARNRARGAKLARMAGCDHTDDPAQLVPADIYLISVSDTQIGAVAENLDFGNAIVADTAGSVACNFTNHMYAIAQELLAEKGLPPQLIGPLISETAAKALGSPSAAAVQTGPARRGDRQTQQKHLGLLEGHPQLQELYQKISTEIWETSKKI